MSWLQDVLDEAAAAGWCVRPRCTTCAAHEFNHRIWRAVQANSRLDLTARGWTRRTLQFLAMELGQLKSISSQDEPAVRWIIMRLHGFLGDAAVEDEFAPGFKESPAGAVLIAMRKHYAARLDANMRRDNAMR